MGSVGATDSKHRTSQIRDAVRSAIPHVVLTVEPGHPQRLFELGAVGLSIEAKELATHDLNATHRSLVTLMRLLGPGVLRIGGGSVDHSWWTSSHEPAPIWATSVVTPADLAALGGLLAKTGWTVILGVDLGHFEPSRAADEARVAEHALGARLRGFEIGNEPDVYGKPVIKLRPSSYGPGQYVEELAAYVTAMRHSAPKLTLYGPDVASPAWLATLVASKRTSFAAITQHYYPLSYTIGKGGCKGTSVPAAIELLSPQVREQESATARALVDLGELAHSKTRISETNNTGSCDTDGGPATSPVFVSALWSLDWILRAASAGVTGLNFHGYLGRCGPYAASPICAEGYAAESAGEVTARPEYYGLLAARQLEGGRFVPTHLRAVDTVADLTTWATVNTAGTVRIAIDNLATEGPAQLVSIPISGYTATSQKLVGDSIERTTGITFGRTRVTGSRLWRPRHERVPRKARSFRLAIPPASAMVVTLRSKQRPSS